jgi:rhamnulose-1-phosphate aldolase/alcohol dehydrogenase
MNNRYCDRDAKSFVDELGPAVPEPLALRVYTSRLIGSDQALVLHGGGNTSVKGRRQTLLGDTVDCLWVKGSGSSLDQVTPKDFPALDLAYLRRLRGLPSLTDEDMVNQLRTHLFDASSPNPSVEALLHAFLPHAFVDHSHADAIIALTNHEDGEVLAQEALGDRVVVLPYIMPGFPLAKAVADALDRSPKVEGIVLAKHGLFTFGDTARESYERHIDLVDACERFAAARARRTVLAAAPADPIAAAQRASARAARALPILRGLLAEPTGSADAPFRRVVADHRAGPDVLAFCDAPGAAALARTGPLTPDHVIRTKAQPLFVEIADWDDDAALRAALEPAVRAYRERYDATFEANARRSARKLIKLDSAPRVVLLPGCGALTFGKTKKDARIAADITEHTLRTKAVAHGMGDYVALAEADLFDMEYWSLEQAKLGTAQDRPLESQIVVVTGGAGAIGRGIAGACAEAGAHVVLLDLDGQAAAAAATELEGRFGSGAAVAVQADVCDEASMRRAFDAACAAFGGVDIVVPNAGIALVKPIERLTAAEARRVADVNYLGVLVTIREAARIFRAQGTGGNVVINASKNVFAPGKDFAAYSASKAAAHQLGKVAALELAPIGVRVNQINADAVFAHEGTPSGLWAEVGPARAQSRGLSLDGLADFYRDRNLLRARVEARHVGRAVVFFASNATPTTGATLPVDGGIPEAFPR